MTTEPISTAEATRHLRIDSDDPGYSDLSAVITAARQHVEEYLNATIANRTRTLTLDAFPAGAIYLPNGPVISVDEIAYTDTDGNAQTVASFILSANAERKIDVLTPAYGAAWPTARTQVGAVTITYTAGMMAGSPSTLDNEAIKSGIKLVLGDLWDNRAGLIIGVSVALNPTLDRLLHMYRRNLGV